MAANTDDMLLCRLAGELWAVFAPWRGPWTGGGAAAAYLARRSFRSGAGLRWRHQGRDRDERDENVEALGRLERRSLLTRRVEKTKVVAVRLHNSGIERACALAGVAGWRDGWDVCCGLATRQAMFKDICRVTSKVLRLPLGDIDERLRWTAEWSLAGTPPHWAGCGDDEAGRANRRLLSELEERTIPALVRGWMESGSDLQGRVSYSPTDAGRAAVAGPPPPEVSVVGSADGCAQAWREGAHAMQIRLAAAPRSEREIGLLPLPAHDAEPYTYATARQGIRAVKDGRGDAQAQHLATGANEGGDKAAPDPSDSRPGQANHRYTEN